MRFSGNASFLKEDEWPFMVNYGFGLVELLEVSDKGPSLNIR